MNIYMLTNNNYLYLGLDFLISEKCEYQCTMLSQNKIHAFFTYYTPNCNDVFVVSSDMFAKNFNYLLNIRDLGLTIIIINKLRNSPLASLFGVCAITYHFSVEELFNCIKKHKSSITQQLPQMPRLTNRERIVLFNITKGVDIHSISDSMGISEKTVYSHMAIIMRKIGLKKRVNVGLLPSVYINYLCAGNQSRVIY